MIFLLLFLTFNLAAMTPAPAVVITSTAVTTTTSTTAAKAMAISTKALKAVLLGMQYKSYVEAPVQSAVAYGVSNGVQWAYPELNNWIAKQMSGNKQYLEALRKEIQAKIDGSWLPMRKEHAQIATLDHIIGMEITNAIDAIANGSKTEAQNAMGKLYGERQVAAMQRQQDPGFTPKISALEVAQAEAIYQDRFSVAPMTDMVGTAVYNTHRDLRSEIAQELLTGLKPEQFGSFDAYLQEVGRRLELLSEIDIKDEMNIPLHVVQGLEQSIHFIDETTKFLRDDLKVDGFIKLCFKMSCCLQNLAQKGSAHYSPQLRAEIDEYFIKNPRVFYDLSHKLQTKGGIFAKFIIRTVVAEVKHQGKRVLRHASNFNQLVEELNKDE